MKLLIITQKVDRQDPVLGFFHHWLKKWAERFASLTVICLQQGEVDLPVKVRVLSLGKENGPSRLKYLWRFYKFIWRERRNYDAVFVHMNQEYVLLAGWLWKLFGKKIFLWRNHHAGSGLTDLAALFCDKIFCTSKFSYTAKFRRTVLMPVGIDTDLFKPDAAVQKIPHSILFLGRLAPVKRPDLLLRALQILAERGIDFTADFYGDALPTDAVYAAAFRGQTTAQFFPGVPNAQTPAIYNRHEIFVNLSPGGMYDKTIFEAAACGTLPLTSNANLVGEWDGRLCFTEGVAEDLAAKLAVLLDLSDEARLILRREVATYVAVRHSLSRLTDKLSQELHGR